jgi:hypothetical protein
MVYWFYGSVSWNQNQTGKCSSEDAGGTSVCVAERVVKPPVASAKADMQVQAVAKAESKGLALVVS